MINLPKIYNICLAIRKTSGKSKLKDIIQNTWHLKKKKNYPVLLKILKVIKTRKVWETVRVCESHSVVSVSLWPHGLYSPWNSLGQNTGVGSLSFLQQIFQTQELNQGLLHCRWVLYQWNFQGNPQEPERDTARRSDVALGEDSITLGEYWRKHKGNSKKYGLYLVIGCQFWFTNYDKTA